MHAELIIQLSCRYFNYISFQLITISLYVNQFQRVKKLVADQKIDVKDALRLILLYALRYERHANCDTVGLLNMLKQRGGMVHVVPRLIEYAGQHARQGDLFNNVKIMDAVKLTRSLIKVKFFFFYTK